LWEVFFKTRKIGLENRRCPFWQKGLKKVKAIQNLNFKKVLRGGGGSIRELDIVFSCLTFI